MSIGELIKGVSEGVSKTPMTRKEFKRQKRLISFRNKTAILLLGSCLAIGVGNEMLKDGDSKVESLSSKKQDPKSVLSDKPAKGSDKKKPEKPIEKPKAVVSPQPKPAAPSAPSAESQNEKEMPMLLDFWAPWCGACRQVLPILDALEKEMAGKVKIVRIDITTDEGEQLYRQYGGGSIPSLKIIKNGRIVDSWVGNTGKADFKHRLQRSIKR